MKPAIRSSAGFMRGGVIYPERDRDDFNGYPPRCGEENAGECNAA